MGAYTKKFKVGDRVRFVMDYGHAKKGDEGTIVSFWAEDGAVVTHKTVNHSCNFSRIELVPVASAEWQPKVGDRVLMKPNSVWACDATVGPGTVFPSEKEGRIIVKFDGDNGFPWNVSVDDLEPLPAAPAAPVPLTITAGKFYKTRDGRKVGPIEISRDGDTAWGATKAGYATVFVDTGLANYEGEHKDDLIAEWVDEPAVIKEKYVGEQPATIANDNATPAKFKVGDRVVSADDGPTKGLFGVIIDDDKSEVPYRVRFEGFDDGHGANDNEWWLQASEVQFPALVTTTPAIVALIENGQPKPSVRPKIHASEEAASKEADRLADEYNGQEFGVFILSSSRRNAAPTYAYEWQRLAAKGEKILALKELRSLTGMTLKGAKDAVEHWLDVGEPHSRIAAA